MGQLQLWLSALEMGSFFGLLALAYYLTLVGAGFFNFAIGPYAMVGGLCTSYLVLYEDMNVWAAAVLAVLAAAALAVFTELAVVRQVQKRSGRGELPALVAVAAIMFAVQQLAGYLFGYTTLPGQALFTFDPVTVGDTVIQPSTVVLLAFTVVAFAAAAVWIRYTRTGRLLRAVGDSTHAATLLGLPVNRVRLIAFLLSGLLAGVTGLLFAPKAGVSSLSGLAWALSSFLAMVIGGTGSVWAPLVGGLLLGLVEVFVPYYFGGQSHVYGLLLVALLFFAFKPSGLFVRRIRT
ncbi:branched-chain amino acid ABC transporter permease [Dactylosporangium matsuzakiense]|uniref:Branched-chain amino acid ABC transporter permease n=1 Tax=Dactylosporangium matsuzakiense TaxID=53360 RepID=A0A9W6KPY3_9ACTN|nr:branched-chain amino acid ABC transporter permease [Dactylosporangium matsuzakiense]UWZ47929.1 branched-chain amino acid ABC transporter permease [Dactylosporangium matsuzakiense]GLL04265.1 branched-chain amino acid ABC transporter permease [Dactylosporangium matsuzakiense]